MRKIKLISSKNEDAHYYQKLQKVEGATNIWGIPVQATSRLETLRAQIKEIDRKLQLMKHYGRGHKPAQALRERRKRLAEQRRKLLNT